MNFNAFGLKVTLTVALVAGMTAIGSMPAQAASLIAGKTFSFYGSASLLSETDATTKLDFLPSYYAPSNDGQAAVAFSSEVGDYEQQFILKDIPLLKTVTGWSLATPSLNWIADSGLPFQYTLTAFNLSKTSNGFEAMIDGIFSPDNLGTVDGYFSSQKKLATLRGTSFSADLTATTSPVGTTPVPTPALLPGLVGLGAAAWRKRQSKLVAA
jgi:hypothetical protein